MSDKPKTLAAKLAEVMTAVGRIPKRGRNNFHGYDYATEADISDAIRKELAERHVILLPAITNETRQAVGEKGSVLTTLEMEMEFLDGDSAESIKKSWRGYGTDKEDKGGYKAMTGGEKYFLLKTFLLPTGDDPEADKDELAQPTQSRRPQSQPTPATRPAQAVNQRTGEIRDLRDAGLLTVRDVSEKDGATNGRKWVKFTVHFSDGSKAATLNQEIGKHAKRAKRENAEVRAITKQGKFGTELEALDIVTAEDAAPDMPDEPAGFMNVSDDSEVPF